MFIPAGSTSSSLPGFLRRVACLCGGLSIGLGLLTEGRGAESPAPTDSERLAIDTMRACLSSMSHDASAYSFEVAPIKEADRTIAFTAQVHAKPRVPSVREYAMVAVVSGAPPELGCDTVHWDLDPARRSSFQSDVLAVVKKLVLAHMMPAVCQIARGDCPPEYRDGCGSFQVLAEAVCRGEAVLELEPSAYEQGDSAYFWVWAGVPSVGEPLPLRRVAVRVCLDAVRANQEANRPLEHGGSIQILKALVRGEVLQACPPPRDLRPEGEK